MSASVETICIPPERIDEVWPHVAGWIAKAVGKGGDWTVEAIRGGLAREECLLWILWDGRLHAVCVTELLLIPKGKICRIVACGGDQVIPWQLAFAPIENYAIAEGCVAMRIEGRTGWQRVFPDYTLAWVCLEKGLN
jgi:hypothetical protein